MSRTPDIRFKGFSGDWEITSLSKLSSLITKGTTPLDKRNIGPINFIKIEDIDSTNGKITTKSTISEKEHNGYLRRSQLKENDILFSIAGTLGRVTSIPAAILPANTNQALAIIRTNKGDLKYIVSALKGPVVDNYLRENPTIGAQPNLSLTQVSALEIPFPSDSEQQDIGRFFFILEKLISDSQSEVDRLQNLKKAMLLKMFPQKGAKVPEIRFKGFSEDWETKKLGNMALFSKGSGYSKSDLAESGVPVVLYGRMYTNYRTVITDVDTFAEPKSGAVYSRGGEVVVPASGETAEDISIASVISRPGIILGGDLNVIAPSSELDPVFLALAISFGSAHNEMAMRAQGASIFHLHNSDLMTINLMVPEKDEQLVIGQYFQNLDSLIEQRQSNTDRLRHLKQAMLQRMFI